MASKLPCPDIQHHIGRNRGMRVQHIPLMNAPISRVLPTPVASAKHREGNSRSKFLTDGKSLQMIFSATAMSASLLRQNFSNATQYLQQNGVAARVNSISLQ
ncbi:hypothetical protein [Candidatus Nitrotoga sp. BS]|uniref:hypothetical protein n=1 Tax=Candidatus Nitrotoga sp. BS TaxID=2890408 RepID=UPI001EF3B198|nr:hypothetical protein [Candidatus Nitrotoga sp. BS]